jgi:hypothetical protein
MAYPHKPDIPTNDAPTRSPELFRLVCRTIEAEPAIDCLGARAIIEPFLTPKTLKVESRESAHVLARTVFIYTFPKKNTPRTTNALNRTFSTLLALGEQRDAIKCQRFFNVAEELAAIAKQKNNSEMRKLSKDPSMQLLTLGRLTFYDTIGSMSLVPEISIDPSSSFSSREPWRINNEAYTVDARSNPVDIVQQTIVTMCPDKGVAIFGCAHGLTEILSDAQMDTASLQETLPANLDVTFDDLLHMM